MDSLDVVAGRVFRSRYNTHVVHYVGFQNWAEYWIVRTVDVPFFLHAQADNNIQKEFGGTFGVTLSQLERNVKLRAYHSSFHVRAASTLDQQRHASRRLCCSIQKSCLLEQWRGQVFDM
jgi:hypothetical protein